MSITIMGYFLIPLGFILLFTNEKYLLYMTILFAGFSGAALVVLGDVGIQPSYYFGILWMARKFIISSKLLIKELFCRDNVWLFIFMQLATFSIIMPMLLPNNIQVMNIEGTVTTLHFSSSNITQLIYLWFCFIFFICLSAYLKCNMKDYEKLVKWYVYGEILICFICLYQIIAIKYNFPFDSLFRQSPHGNVQGTRIYGPCIEASMLCYYLVSALPLYLRWKKNIWTTFFLLINIALGVYSFSSTYIIGLVIWIISEVIIMMIKGKIKISKKMITIVLLMMVISIIMLAISSDYIIYVLQKLLDTLTKKNFSGNQRRDSFKLLINTFLEAPLLGVGFGTCRGNDLLSTWLADVGICGILAIACFLHNKTFGKSYPIEFRIANILVWALMLISVPEPYNIFIWILLAVPVQNNISYKK